MTALPPDAMADLYRLVAELEQRLESSFVAHDEAIARQAATAQENAVLRNELGVTRDRQNASADILSTIANASGDAQASLQRIAETTARLFDASSVTIRIADGDKWGQTIRYGAGSERIGKEVPATQLEIGARNLPSAVFRLNQQIHVPDLNNLVPEMADWPGLVTSRASGILTVAGTPLRREGKPIGILIVYRDHPAPFTDEELALQQSFADQAAIALENARLFNESREALARQTATAEVMQVINSSPGNLAPVLDAILEKAMRPCEAQIGALWTFDGDYMHAAASRGAPPAYLEFLQRGPHRPSHLQLQLLEGTAGFVQVADLTLTEGYRTGDPLPRAAADLGGIRTLLVVPMRKDGALIGTFGIYRQEVRPFSDRQIALVQSFAAQAVIAMENARLFNETREALARQTATSEILRVINESPTDVQPVFDAIVLTATRLFERDMAFILACDATTYWPVATARPEGLLATPHLARVAIDTSANFPSRVIVTGKNLHVPDWSAVELPEYERMVHETLGINSALYLPLLREGKCIGLLGIAGKRAEIFGESEIALAESFRDQALIAIENTRLFNETREALERETSSADILRVISSSPTDVQPVFDAIVASLLQLFDTQFAVVQLLRDGVVTMPAAGGKPGFERLAERFPRPLDDATIGGMVMLSKRTQQFLAQDDSAAPPETRRFARDFGFNSVLFTPMIHDGEVIGAIGTANPDARVFDPHQVALIETFARQAVIAIQNTRLFNEIREALERQTATADILKVIASSPDDVQPVFEAIAERSNRLIDGLSTAVHRVIDDALHLAAFTRTTPAGDAALRASFPRPLSSAAWGENIRNGETVHIPDAEIEWAGQPTLLEMARLRGFRSLLFVPLLRDGATIGIISVSRKEAGRFAPHHVQLLQTFADQAVIAIENVRLFNETREALERQTATADILKVIASSPNDVQPVFDVIVEHAVRLCGGRMGRVYRYQDGMIHLVAGHGLSVPGLSKVHEVYPRPVADDTTAGRAILSRQANFVANIETDESVPALSRQMIEALGTRSQVTVPMLRGGEPIGAITVGWADPAAYGDTQVTLLQTFADQAVIAIENVRLFNETREALERQTATADILKVIASSPSDVQPVFEAIAERSKRLVDALSTTVFRLEDGVMHLKAFTTTNPEADATLKTMFPAPLSNFSWGEAISNGDIHRVVDTEQEIEGMRELARLRGYRSMLFVPLLRDGAPIGLIAVTRVEPGPFVEHHVQLLQTFADQAVIAIENVRLFDEVQARTEDLRESLQQQTATADVLKVISRSTFDLKTVLDTLIASAAQLCDADAGHIYLREAETYKLAACSGFSIEYEEFMRRHAIVPGRGSLIGRTAEEGSIVSIPDAPNDPEYTFREAQRLGGFRTMLGIPMLRDGAPIGVLALTRSEVRTFTDKQIELVTTFADQAVIAIENVRLFVEVQERTRELSQSLDELRTAQDRLVQTEKLASLGQLTAGIAHEIKNPLNFVNNFAALSAELTGELNDLLKPVALGEGTREEVDELTRMLKGNLEKIVQHGKRADSIVKNMLLHSREGSGEHRPADINALLDESLNLAYHGARAEKREFNVTLQRDFDDMAGTIELFPQEITRVFLNLIANGFYAVTKRRTETGNSGFEPTVRAATKNLGNKVEIRIRDNGTGIPAEVKEKMFNPFFTTKPAGEGTGLGLSMSHDIIVKQHGGTIDVETEPGEFTEFRIVLPRASNISKQDQQN